MRGTYTTHGLIKFLVATRVSVTRTKRPAFLFRGAITGRERGPKVEAEAQGDLICLFRRSPRRATPLHSGVSLFTGLAYSRARAYFSRPPRSVACLRVIITQTRNLSRPGPTNEMVFRLAVADSLCSKEDVGQRGG